jgi:hypothetical protein
MTIRKLMLFYRRTAGKAGKQLALLLILPTLPHTGARSRSGVNEWQLPPIPHACEDRNRADPGRCTHTQVRPQRGRPSPALPASAADARAVVAGFEPR